MIFLLPHYMWEEIKKGLSVLKPEFGVERDFVPLLQGGPLLQNYILCPEILISAVKSE